MKKIILLLSLLSFNAFAAKVNVNTADAQTIAEALTGVGLKKTEAIVEHRKTVGAFTNYDDFMAVKGIGVKTVEKNKADILFK